MPRITENHSTVATKRQIHRENKMRRTVMRKTAHKLTSVAATTGNEAMHLMVWGDIK